MYVRTCRCRPPFPCLLSSSSPPSRPPHAILVFPSSTVHITPGSLEALTTHARGPPQLGLGNECDNHTYNIQYTVCTHDHDNTPCMRNHAGRHHCIQRAVDNFVWCNAPFFSHPKQYSSTLKSYTPHHNSLLLQRIICSTFELVLLRHLPTSSSLAWTNSFGCELGSCLAQLRTCVTPRSLRASRFLASSLAPMQMCGLTRDGPRLTRQTQPSREEKAKGQERK